MPKPQRRSKKKTRWCRAALPGRCSHIQSRQPTLISFSFFSYHCQEKVAGELQIHIHSAALGGCCKLLVSVLTLIGANEQHSHVLSKDPQTGGGYRFFTQILQFSTREQMLRSLKWWLQISPDVFYIIHVFLFYFTIWITLEETIFNLESTEHMFYFSSTAHEEAKVTRATSGMSLFSASSRVLNASVPLTPTVLCSSLKCASNSPSPLKSRWFGGSTAACLFNLSFRERIYNSSLSHTPLHTPPLSSPTPFLCCLHSAPKTKIL